MYLSKNYEKAAVAMSRLGLRHRDLEGQPEQAQANNLDRIEKAFESYDAMDLPRAVS